MNNYRLKKLQNLTQAEQQVKAGVRERIQAGEHTRRKRVLPAIITLSASAIAVFLLFIFLTPAQRPSVQLNNIFSLSPVDIPQLEPRHSYYLATDLQWHGEKDVLLMGIQLTDEDGHDLEYEKNNLEMQLFIPSEPTENGFYTAHNIVDLQYFEPFTMERQTSYPVALNIVVSEHFEQQPIFVKVRFQLDGEELNLRAEIPALHQLDVKPVDIPQLVESLGLAPEEQQAYATFKETLNAEALRDLTPIQVARLYQVAGLEGDDALQYAFYTTEPDRIQWTYEEQLSFGPFHQAPIERLVQEFYDLSKGEFIQTADNEGYISYKLSTSEYLSGFQLIRNRDGIWQVSFMPIQ